MHEPETLARPGAGHPHPAGARLVLRPIPVPVKLHLHAPVLVGEDLVTRRADDDGRLRPLHHGLGALARRPIRHGALQRREAALVARRGRLCSALVGRLADRDLRARHQVLAVVALPQRALQRQQPPGAQAARIAVTAGDLGGRGELLHLRAHELLAVAFLVIKARVVEDLQVAQRVGARLAARLPQIELRAREVVVLDHRRARLHALRAGQLPDAFLVQHRGAVRVAHRQRLADGGAGAGGVGQHQRVLAGLVLEEVVDAFLLHQARQEVEVALAVLHAVDPGREGRGGAVVDGGDGVVGQHRVDDLQHRLVLEDLAVLGLREEPEPGRYWKKRPDWPTSEICSTMPSKQRGSPASSPTFMRTVTCWPSRAVKSMSALGLRATME